MQDKPFVAQIDSSQTSNDKPSHSDTVFRIKQQNKTKKTKTNNMLMNVLFRLRKKKTEKKIARQ